MKTAVVVGVFVLVACLHLQANGAVVEGKTKDCNVEPEGFGNTCHKYTCNKETGFFTIFTCGVSALNCPEGQVAEQSSADLTKSYPDCCPQLFCRGA